MLNTVSKKITGSILMDEKTKESVLNFLIQYYVQNGKQFDRGDVPLSQQLTTIPLHILRATLQILREEDLVDFIEHAGYLHHIEATPKGMAYFERKKQAQKEKWEMKKADWIKCTIFAIIGFIFNIIIQWLKTNPRP
ncbi:MAG: hypothetical protein A4E55_00222 [Pelotomaculum sp. PtaU1.Bin035]|nr:MAG: hypothetical protein A4E55_00222 [Pelotomaculum sp. PtaU1.Bin035]